MLVGFIGDCHGDFGLLVDAVNKIQNDCLNLYGVLPSKIIQLGDMGFYPEGTLPKLPNLKRDPSQKFYFIRGNHEDHDSLPLGASQPQDVADEWPEWEFVPDGYYEDGILFIGGAWSIDQEFRKKKEEYYNSLGVKFIYKWYPSEEITKLKMGQIRAVTHKGLKVIVSHDGPNCLYEQLCNPAFGPPRRTRTADFLDKVLLEKAPERIIFGHHHKREDFNIQHPATKNIKGHCIDMLRNRHSLDTATCILRL